MLTRVAGHVPPAILLLTSQVPLLVGEVDCRLVFLPPLLRLQNTCYL